jgi:hypothetical protein
VTLSIVEHENLSLSQIEDLRLAASKLLVS